MSQLARMARWWAPVVVLAAALGGWAAPAPTVPRETVYTARGTYHVWTRTDVRASDVDLPFPAGLVLESTAYTVRDRKNRDFLQYARVLLTTTLTTEELTTQYLTALGPTAQREANASGEVRLAVGDAALCRIVTITPQANVRHVTLERVRHYDIPARVYTDRERQVIRLLDEVTRTYAAAGHLAYSYTYVVEQSADGKTEPPSPPLTWQVEFTRPDRLHVNVAADKTDALDIVATDGKLRITRPDTQPEERPFAGALTIDLVPELQDDPIARLLLHDPLLSERVDYLAIVPVPNVPLSRQAEIVLTYPERFATLRIRVDQQRKMIVQSDITVKMEGHQSHVTRRYSYRALDPVVTPSPPASGAVTEHAPAGN